jgi:hypothetical protein
MKQDYARKRQRYSARGRRRKNLILTLTIISTRITQELKQLS